MELPPLSFSHCHISLSLSLCTWTGSVLFSGPFFLSHPSNLSPWVDLAFALSLSLSLSLFASFHQCSMFVASIIQGAGGLAWWNTTLSLFFLTKVFILILVVSFKHVGKAQHSLSFSFLSIISFLDGNSVRLCIRVYESSVGDEWHSCISQSVRHIMDDWVNIQREIVWQRCISELERRHIMHIHQRFMGWTRWSVGWRRIESTRFPHWCSPSICWRRWQTSSRYAWCRSVVAHM